jgi:hypothetical protein
MAHSENMCGIHELSRTHTWLKAFRCWPFRELTGLSLECSAENLEHTPQWIIWRASNLAWEKRVSVQDRGGNLLHIFSARYVVPLQLAYMRRWLFTIFKIRVVKKIKNAFSSLSHSALSHAACFTLIDICRPQAQRAIYFLFTIYCTSARSSYSGIWILFFRVVIYKKVNCTSDHENC